MHAADRPDHDRLERERDHWDHAVPDADEVVTQFDEGPDDWIAAIVEAAGPADGRTVLDFGCGVGLLSAELARRGFDVIGLDISGVSLARAAALRDHAGLDFELIEAGLEQRLLPDGRTVDLLVGNNALHHLDLEIYGPLLREAVAPGGRAIFVESMATNPALMLARRHLVGRPGIARFGTTDEHPLTDDDLTYLGHLFGGVRRRVPRMVMFRLVDRQVLRGRLPLLGKALRAIDDRINRSGRWDRLSFRALVELGPIPTP
jgi:SAM-dependent methyltransferase